MPEGNELESSASGSGLRLLIKVERGPGEGIIGDADLSRRGSSEGVSFTSEARAGAMWTLGGSGTGYWSSMGFGIGIGLEMRPRIDWEPVWERVMLARGGEPLPAVEPVVVLQDFFIMMAVIEDGRVPAGTSDGAQVCWVGQPR